MRRLCEQVRDLLWPRWRRFGDCRRSRLDRELAQNPFAAAEADLSKIAISPARRIFGRESEERQIAWRPGFILPLSAIILSWPPSIASATPASANGADR